MKLFILLLLISPAFAKGPVFQEKGGVIAIEAESTSSRLKKWKKKTDVADFSGECHLEFTGNKTESGPPESPLKYRFQINKPGNYTLVLRARKRLETKRADISNDCYVAMKGDFETGGDTPLKVLKSDTKIYGGEPDSWGWCRKLDHNHKKTDPIYLFKKGAIYEFTIHGRSKNFNLDRFLFVHESENLRDVMKKNPKESKSDEPGESQPAGYPEHELTNQQGVKITAKLVDKKGYNLVIIFKGKRQTIDVRSLSDEAQEFLKGWEP